VGGPVWLSAIFAAMMLAVAVYCTGRLVAARRWRRPTELDTDGAHVVMGVAMAGMLVSGLRAPLPAGLWEGVFGVGAVWFGAQALRARRGPATSPWRCLHATPHLVECIAMVYMFLLLPAAVVARSAIGQVGAMAVSPTESRFSFLALLMAVFLLGYVIWLGDRLMLRSPALAAQPPPAPALVTVPSAAATSAVTPATVSAAVTPDACHACHAAAPAARYLAPRCALLCKAAMGMTMGYMLILML
jgi:Domain of unknown function (DUF5134)